MSENEEVAPVLVLTGPPGAGKTTLASRLAETSGRPAAHLHSDDFFDYIKSGFIAPWLRESAHQNRTISRALAAAACAYARGGYWVVLDGVVGPWHLDMYRDESRRTGVPLDYVVLRPDRETAVRRARDREITPLPTYPPNIYDGFSDLGPFEGHAIDTTNLEVEAAVGHVRAGLAAGRFRLD